MSKLTPDMTYASDATKLIGGTPLVLLDEFAPNLLGKLESFNPLASVKDRIGVAMLEAAEEEGMLSPDTVLIEPTSGNTGIGLAFAAAAKGYDLVLTMPASMSEERRALLRAFGAELELTPADEGMTGAINRAQEMAETESDAFIPQQFQNLANPRIHRETTGPEIWEATNGEADVLVAGVGTGGTMTGVAEYFKEERGKTEFVAIAVEPEESAVLSGHEPGSHSIQGIGAGFVPDVYREELVDDVRTVSEGDAKSAARELARSTGILGGISSGAALHVATNVGHEPEFADALVVTVLPDSGERYLSTDLFG